MIPKDEMKEMNETLSEVAKMKLQFDLLKQVIMSHLELDYSENKMRLESDSLLLEVMWLIEGKEMADLLMLKQKAKELDDRVSEAEKERLKHEVAMTKEDDNG